MAGIRRATVLSDYLVRAADTRPEALAIIAEDRRLTYADLLTESRALARHLASCGVRRGDRVMVMGANTPETVIAVWAVQLAGAAMSMINPLTKTAKVLQLLTDCEPRALLADAQRWRDWEPAASEYGGLLSIVAWGPIEPESMGESRGVITGWDEALRAGESEAVVRRRPIDEDLAAIMYTSGSTGAPKGVMLSHRNMITATESILEYLDTDDDEVILGVLPLAFGYGLNQMIQSVAAGSVLVMERSFAFPARVLETLERERVTGFAGVPTVFGTLLGLEGLGRHDLTSVRYVTNAGAALPPGYLRALHDTFPNARVYSMYGQTECTRISYLPPADALRKPGSIGIPIPNTDFWIVDDEDRPVGPGTVGELVVRGGTVMRGYWNQPERTREKLRLGPLAGERVLYTGDLCSVDDEGYLYFVSRMDDVFKSGGEKVAPKEIENVLLDMAGVAEAAVVGVPDDRLGMSIKAFVVLGRGASLTERDIQRECRRVLESFLVPHRVEFLSELPKTASGKIRKVELK